MYPRGCTLAPTGRATTPVLTSGYIAFPLNRPVCTLTQHGKGRVCVLGSSDMLADGWVEKEKNQKLGLALARWCLHDPEVSLDTADARDPDVREPAPVPDVASMADRLRSCLQDSEDLPRDFAEMFDMRQFRFHTSLVPEAMGLFEVRVAGGDRGGAVAHCPPPRSWT